MSIKLKTLLEGYAWERKADGSLPTLKDAIAVHEANEANSALEIKIAKLEKEIADLKHQYYSVSDLAPEREKQLRQKMGEKGRELNRAKRERKTGGAGYQGNPLKKEPKEPRWQDSDGDGKWYEPGQDVKKINEQPNGKELKQVNLVGNKKDLYNTQDTQNNFKIPLGLTPFKSSGNITYDRAAKQLSYNIDIDANLDLRDVIEQMRKLNWIDKKAYNDILSNMWI